MIELDPRDLERALGRSASSYTVEAIDPHLRIHSVTAGVYRVRCDGDSLVIKIVRHGVDATPDGLWQSGADVGHRNYWKREWLAFGSGLLNALPGQLRAPRTLLTTETDNGDCWIWMEDVAGRTGAALGLDDYATIAHALGTTQGAYASGSVELPAQPWLSRQWLRGWVEVCAPFVTTTAQDTRWGDARLTALELLRTRVLSLWDRRDELFAVADEPPLTVTHWDFWPANLYATDNTAVAIDWSQVGISGITHDLDQLTVDPVWMHVRPDEAIEAIEERVLPAYRTGLSQSGFDIEAELLHRWYAATAALRYAWLGGGQVDLVTDPQRAQFHEERFGRDIATITATKARALAHVLSLGEGVLAG
jgi:hypothetical protein